MTMSDHFSWVDIYSGLINALIFIPPIFALFFWELITWHI